MSLKQANYVGRTLEGYRITAELSSDLSSRLFLGESASSPKEYVAIKLLYAQQPDSQQKEHFLQEISFLKELRHKHILPIISAGIDKGTPYIVSEYTPGSVYKLMQSNFSCPLKLDETLTIVSQVAKALDYLHQQQVLHRNLTPHSILINSRGEALLADFRLNTFPPADDGGDGNIDSYIYRAPEEVAGSPCPASDQYSLAAIAYEMLTGRKPYVVAAENTQEYQRTTLLVPPTQLNATLPASVEEALMHALEPDPLKRYSDIQAFMAALELCGPNAESTSLPSVSFLPVPDAQVQSLTHPVIVQSATHRPAFSRWNRAGEENEKKHIRRAWILVGLICLLVFSGVVGTSLLLFPRRPEVRLSLTPTTQPDATRSIQATASPTPRVSGLPTRNAQATATSAVATPTPTPTTGPEPTPTTGSTGSTPAPTPTTGTVPTPTPTPTCYLIIICSSN